MILQRFESRIVVGRVVGGEPSRLQAVSASEHLYMARIQTYLSRDTILIQDADDDRSDVCPGVMPLQQCEGKLVFPKLPLIWLVNWAVDIVCGD